MLLQFIELGIYERQEDEAPYHITYDVIVKGKVIKTCDYLNTALIEVADQIDKLIEGDKDG